MYFVFQIKHSYVRYKSINFKTYLCAEDACDLVAK